jgi:hypothetical protein
MKHRTPPANYYLRAGLFYEGTERRSEPHFYLILITKQPQ